MTLQDLTNNKDRITKKIQYQMLGDGTARQVMVKPVMAKMVAYLNSRAEYQAMKPTMANIDKLTSVCTLAWIKNDYKSMMSQIEKDAFEAKREAAKIGSHSTFY